MADLSKVFIRKLSADDRAEFIALAQKSQQFLWPWIDPPATPERFDAYLHSRSTPNDIGFVICEEFSQQIVGIINVTCIVADISSPLILVTGSASRSPTVVT